MQAQLPNSLEHAWRSVTQRAEAAAVGRPVRVLAVSKTQPPAAIRALAGFGQRAFGENYVQEARAKQVALADCTLEWHMIGPLQSNKCRDVAEHFDWLQTLDRMKLVALLARHRPEIRDPLQVLIQVNIDDEISKSGCAPEEITALADAIAEQPRLRLRGLMAIPAPDAVLGKRTRAFVRMRQCFEVLRVSHPAADTLSMGMSEDFELAIREGATLVRVGSLLFGPRN
jgi:pyridoxal phosphate enzyme (YggS family)